MESKAKVKATKDSVRESVISAPIEKNAELAGVFDAWRDMGDFCIVTSNPFKNKDIYDYIADKDIQVAFYSDALFLNYFADFMVSRWSAVFICVDDFSSLSLIFNKLRMIRSIVPEVTVIIASKEFGNSDLSKERLPICDVSVKLPLGDQSLDEIILCARRNNIAWNIRLKELEADAGTSTLLVIREEERRKAKLASVKRRRALSRLSQQEIAEAGQ